MEKSKLSPVLIFFMAMPMIAVVIMPKAYPFSAYAKIRKS